MQSCDSSASKMHRSLPTLIVTLAGTRENGQNCVKIEAGGHISGPLKKLHRLSSAGKEVEHE